MKWNLYHSLRPRRMSQTIRLGSLVVEISFVEERIVVDNLKEEMGRGEGGSENEGMEGEI